MKAKSWIARMTASFLMLTMLAGGAASADSVQVTADRLNMRKEANASSKAVAVVEKDAELSFISEADGWYQVKNGSKTGYVMSEYVKLDMAQVKADVDANTEVYSPARAARTTERVNMRSMPLTGADIVRVADKNDKVSVLGKCGDWYQVKYDGKTGFIMGGYLTIEEETAPEADSGLIEINPEENYAAALSGKTTDRVNLRKADSTSSGIVKVLKEGAGIVVLGEAGSWYKVNADGKIGFIAKDYVSLETADAPAQNNPSAETVYSSEKSGQTTERVNLRAGATTSSDVKRIINKKATVIVLGEQGDFYQVKVADVTGYIAKAYVSLNETIHEESSGSSDVSYAAPIAAKTTVSVNMRREPEGEILFTLPAGTSVQKIGEQGAWYKVTYGNSTGYIAKNYVSDEITAPIQPDNSTGSDGEGKTGYITAQSLNMRRGAGTEYGVIKVLKHGDEVTYYSLTDGWYLIKAGDDTGYISQKYLGTAKPESAPSNPGNQTNGDVILSDWWTGDIRDTFKVGVIATVTDIETGLSWQVKRSGGSNHADVQPLTAEDTAKMKQAYGGKWSWNRRAIWVTVGGKRYAASMNGMPHGTGSIKTNNFDGHHCIHFLNSRTHTGNRLDSAHQAAVQKAYKAG